MQLLQLQLVQKLLHIQKIRYDIQLISTQLLCLTTAMSTGFYILIWLPESDIRIIKKDNLCIQLLNNKIFWLGNSLE
ncbi:unnamed protein product [Paramecium sonneborni]|uniref:Uncharacterized protein n=1 Tax=Paramecium sonneborni TaxID=65129 RepID=A0A8S1QK99_9CILI|nr:unnamed protein product [Paramecium sonneborni]